MARKPNFNFERQERDRAKAAKKAAKIDAKDAKKREEGVGSNVADTVLPPPASQGTGQ